MSNGGKKIIRLFVLGGVVTAGVFIAVIMLFMARATHYRVYAAPIDPPEGYPKLILSSMSVEPELVHTGGATLTYTIEIVNTGAYTAFNTSMADVLPVNTTYNNDATSSVPPAPEYISGILSWNGTVGFDSSVTVTFSVDVLPDYQGVVTNTAVISAPLAGDPVYVGADAMVTDEPFFTIGKTSYPPIPGPNQPLTYTLSVTNRGQMAVGVPITVTDHIPQDTSFLSAGTDGSYDQAENKVTWLRTVNLGTGESAEFDFTVLVGDVPSGTVVSNVDYTISSTVSEIAVGEPYTITVLDPILFLYKDTDPFPPGSNREMTYTLTLLNKGSLATDLVVSDTLPAGVTYVRGGDLVGDTVRWTLPRLDTGEAAEFSFTVFIGDVAEVPVLNESYSVCSAQGVCQLGIPLTSIVKGPQFVAQAFLDPIAKKPGGGGGPVTPTLTLRNLGPGNALNAMALLYFRRISVSYTDMLVIPDTGNLTVGPDCGEKCDSFRWVGDLGVGEVVTFTVTEGQSTIGGDEGTPYTATLVVTDTLGAFTSEPITGTAVGHVTHFANLIPTKSAPPVIGPGQIMTYTIQVFNSGLSTDVPPYPTLTDTVPVSTSLVSVADGGTSFEVDGHTVVSWTLPAMSPGDRLARSFSVQADSDLVSGTLIVNDDYRASWYDVGASVTQTYTLSNTGTPITTVVREVGLIDSFKTVTPTHALPGADNLLTYTVHVVNSSPVGLSGVRLYDILPWQSSTYQRDAQVSSGQLISDIVSLDWYGDVGPLSEELITFTVKVDPFYEGAVTNTAVITHTSLLSPVQVEAVAYITDDPVLQISKQASPDPVITGNELLYTIRVLNLGEMATELVVVDTLPEHTQFIPHSASGNGQFDGQQVTWGFPVLEGGEEKLLNFRVLVNSLSDIINTNYYVSSEEGVTAYGVPLVTKVGFAGSRLVIPIVMK
ncbi:MAG TPA: hypothetical protein VLA49_05735 [Anaerolineales bacterium]|nr:hypothetical protein [Anaerolineales bacterium]